MKRKQNDTPKEKPTTQTKKQKTKGKEIDDDEPPQLIPVEPTKITAVDSAGKKTPLEFFSETVNTDKLPSPELVQQFEKSFGHSIPKDYLHFLSKYNGGHPVTGGISKKDYEVSFFLMLTEPKDLDAENEEEEDDDDDDDDDLYSSSIPFFLDLYKSGLPENHLPIAAAQGFGSLFLIDLTPKSKTHGAVFYVDLPEDDDEDDEDEEEETKEKKQKTEKSTNTEPPKPELLAPSFNAFLQLFLTKEQQEKRDEEQKEKRIKMLTSAPIAGSIKQFVNKFKKNFPHLEEHVRSIVIQFENEGLLPVFAHRSDDSMHSAPESAAYAGSPNNALMRLVSLAVFFLEKEGQRAAQQKLSRQRKNKKGKGAAAAANKIEEQKPITCTADQIYEWIESVFVIESSKDSENLMGLAHFIGPDDLEELILHWENNYSEDPFVVLVDQSTEEDKDGEEDLKDKEAEDEMEDDNDRGKLIYLLPDSRRKRLRKLFVKSALDVEVEKKRFITESGDATEDFIELTKKVFDRFDKDKDGFWNFEEWNSFLKETGEKEHTSLTEFKEFIASFNGLNDDEDEDEEVNGIEESLWIKISVDAVMMDPDHEKSQYQKLGFDYPVERFY